MSARTLSSHLKPDDPQVRVRAAHCRALPVDLPVRVAQVVLDGEESGWALDTARSTSPFFAWAIAGVKK